MTNGRTRDAAGHIDIVSCGTGFPSDTGVLTLLEEADAVYGSRSLMALCPVPVKNARIIGSGARKDAEEVLALAGRGNASWCWPRATPSHHGFGGTLAALRTPGDNLAYHPGITAFQALFCRLGLPWQDARLFCVHSGEGLPSRRHSRSAAVRNLCGEPLPGARHRPRRARHASRIGPTRRDHRRTHRLGRRTHPVRTLGELADAACGPTSILVIFPTAHADCHVQDAAATTRGSASIQAPILALGPSGRSLRARKQPDHGIGRACRHPGHGCASRLGGRSGTSGPEAAPWVWKRPPCARPSAYTASSATPNAAR